MTAEEIRLIATRPAGANARFIERLNATARADLHVIESPLLEIIGVPQKRSVAFDAAVFTSANGVRFAPNGEGQVAYCVGAATAEAASAAGWTAQISGRDAASLVEALQELKPKGTLVHFCGVHTRGDVTRHLGQAGLQITAETVYDQREARLTQAARDALDADVPVIVPLFSPRTAQIFAVQSRAVAPLYLAALSGAVADETAELRHSAIEIATTPDLDGMVCAVEKLIEQARAG